MVELCPNVQSIISPTALPISGDEWTRLTMLQLTEPFVRVAERMTKLVRFDTQVYTDWEVLLGVATIFFIMVS